MQALVQIVEADLENEQHQRDVLALTAQYALDPMGNAGPLPAEVLARLIAGLRAHPTTLILMAYRDGKPVGIATCFRGFSTFYAKPLLNIHDFSVVPEHRGQGIGRQLLRAVERRAREAGCCRVTLEVQEGNTAARHVYDSIGFGPAVYGEGTGSSLFYIKPL
jgi:GNAT superfamily N-acetyltransferase